MAAQQSPNKSSHGGPGRGQGRKPLAAGEPTVRVTVRITQSMYDWLQQRGEIAETVRQLIADARNTELSIR